MTSDLQINDIAAAVVGVVSGCFLSTLPAQGSEPHAIVAPLDQAACFGLNVCAQDDDSLMRRFSGPGDDPAALEDLEGDVLPAGVVLKPPVAYLVCTVAQRVDTGGQWLYLADVRGRARVADEAARVHVRKDGLKH